jgi:hypothetical protein
VAAFVERRWSAAGMVASWFGVLPNDFRAVRFPVSYGDDSLPGNAILIAESSSDRAGGVERDVRVRAPDAGDANVNPVDPYRKVLVDQRWRTRTRRW